MTLRRFSVVLALLLTLVLAWAAYWASAAHALRRLVEAWVVRERAAGAELRFAGPTIDGFPAALELSVRDLHWVRADGLVVSAPTLRLSAAPWQPLAIAHEAGGGLRLERPGARGLPALVLTAAAAAGDLTLDTGGGVRAGAVTLDAPVLRIGPGGDGTPALRAARLALSAALPESPPVDRGAPGLTASVAVGGLTLPGALPERLATVEDAALRLSVPGPLPDSLTAAGLRPWNAAGGTVELVLERMAWGGMAATGDATLALDSALQPIGAGSVSVAGLDALVAALKETGTLDEGLAGLATAGIGLLAKPGPDGTRTVTLPLSLQDRSLTLGPFPLARIPPVAWE